MFEMSTLTKDALIELIRDKVGYPVKEAKDILEMILEEVKAKLEKGAEVKISGFGKWIVKEKRSRPGRNPHTGQKIEITARRVVTFHPSDKLRDCVNRQVPPTDLLKSSGNSDD
jgi:integration host factor subunit alpha